MNRILVIDDDAAVRWVLQRSLEHAGFDVMTAENGFEGIAMVDQSAPDAIVLDLMMPVMDGFAVLRALRENHLTATIPVLVLTAVTASEIATACEQAGAQRVMTKPFEPPVLAAAINALLAISTASSLPS
jgi:CheY-like chemotaxis protein